MRLALPRQICFVFTLFSRSCVFTVFFRSSCLFGIHSSCGRNLGSVGSGGFAWRHTRNKLDYVFGQVRSTILHAGSKSSYSVYHAPLRRARTRSMFGCIISAFRRLTSARLLISLFLMRTNGNYWRENNPRSATRAKRAWNIRKN